MSMVLYVCVSGSMTVTVDVIRMSGTMARSWKTFSSQSRNGRTDNNENCSTSSSTGFLFHKKIFLTQQYCFSRRRRDEEVTCYGDLGCFRDEVRLFAFSFFKPWNISGTFQLPWHVAIAPWRDRNRLPLVHTTKPRTAPGSEQLPIISDEQTFQVLEYNNVTTVSNSFFNASSPTKVIIHGFGSSCDKVWAREMRLSFLAVVSLDSKKEF